eukprot:scaffold4837_cov163-Ochromonas_danica.AAC.8
MPQEFYQQIDDFLKKPPPNFTAKDVIKKKSKNNNNNSHNNNSNSNSKVSNVSDLSSAPHLPSINSTVTTTTTTTTTAKQRGGGGGLGVDGVNKGKKSSISLKKDNPISSRVYDTIAPNQQTSSNAPAIDSQLLKEAFEYTDRLLREAVMEEVLEKQSVADPRQHGKHAGNNGGDNSGTRQPKQSSRLVSKYAAYVEQRGQDIAYDNNGMFPKSAPAEVMRQESSKAHGDVGRKGMNKRESNSGSGRSGSGGMGAVKMVRNLKSKSNQELTTASAAPTTRRQQSLAGGDFVVTRETETDLKRIPVDFDSLLSNFQTGATLDKLRKELAESQQSLAQSELIVQQLTGLKSLGGAGKKRRRENSGTSLLSNRENPAYHELAHRGEWGSVCIHVTATARVGSAVLAFLPVIYHSTWGKYNHEGEGISTRFHGKCNAKQSTTCARFTGTLGLQFWSDNNLYLEVIITPIYLVNVVLEEVMSSVYKVVREATVSENILSPFNPNRGLAFIVDRKQLQNKITSLKKKYNIFKALTDNSCSQAAMTGGSATWGMWKNGLAKQSRGFG